MAFARSSEAQLRLAQRRLAEYLERGKPATGNGRARAQEPVTTNAKLRIREADGNGHKMTVPTIAAYGGSPGETTPTNGRNGGPAVAAADDEIRQPTLRALRKKVVRNTGQVPAASETVVPAEGVQIVEPGEVATAAMPAPATREIVTPRAAEDHAAGPRSGAREGQPPQRPRSKTMTPAALAANRANAQKSTGPVTPEGKRKVTRNSLEDGFFAQQEDNIVGRDIASGVVYEEIRD